MEDFNPYAPPSATMLDPHLAVEEGLWADGKILVVRKGSPFPDRCLRCNAPAEGYRLKRTLSWHPAGWYLLVIFNILIYIIVAMCVRWTAKVALPFCPKHRSQRRRAIIAGWIGGLVGIAGAIYWVGHPEYPGLLSGGILLAVVSILYGAIRSQLVVPQAIDKHFARLQKVGPEFLATVPPWN